MNLLELPVLFYVVCLTFQSTGLVDEVVLIVACSTSPFAPSTAPSTSPTTTSSTAWSHRGQQCGAGDDVGVVLCAGVAKLSVRAPRASTHLARYVLFV